MVSSPAAVFVTSLVESSPTDRPFVDDTVKQCNTGNDDRTLKLLTNYEPRR